jgi:ATP-dependent Clp protease ATP-binding subunit ClpA
MFERFTPDARAAVKCAQEEARSLRHPSIGTEHLVLAMLAGECLGGQLLRARGMSQQAARKRLEDWDGTGGRLDPGALAAIGIDLEAVRRAAEDRFGTGALSGGTTPMPRGHLPFTKHAKKVLELAVRESVATDAGEINSGHLLLGVIAEHDGLGARLILDADLDLDDLRREARSRAAHRAA